MTPKILCSHLLENPQENGITFLNSKSDKLKLWNTPF